MEYRITDTSPVICMSLEPKENVHSCEFCNRQFPSRSSLVKHRWEGTHMWKCHACKNLFRRKPDAHRHWIKKNHGSDYRNPTPVVLTVPKCSSSRNLGVGSPADGKLLINSFTRQLEELGSDAISDEDGTDHLCLTVQVKTEPEEDIVNEHIINDHINQTSGRRKSKVPITATVKTEPEEDIVNEHMINDHINQTSGRRKSKIPLTTTGSAKCKYCSRVFNSYAACQKHIYDKANRYKCTKCECIFRRPSLCKDHWGFTHKGTYQPPIHFKLSAPECAHASWNKPSDIPVKVLGTVEPKAMPRLKLRGKVWRVNEEVVDERFGSRSDRPVVNKLPIAVRSQEDACKTDSSEMMALPPEITSLEHLHGNNVNPENIGRSSRQLVHRGTDSYIEYKRRWENERLRLAAECAKEAAQLAENIHELQALLLEKQQELTQLLEMSAPEDYVQ